jgi:serine protease inhibitor
MRCRAYLEAAIRFEATTMESRIPVFRTTLLAGAACLSGLLLASCGDGSPLGPANEITELPRPLSVAEELLIDAGNDFAFRFLAQVNEEEPGSSLFLSPLSASMALGMTLNGAAGGTFEEMRSTLGFGTLSMEQINQGYRDLLDLLKGLDPMVELGIGNSIWYRQGFEVRTDFLGRTRDFFDAEVRALNFSDPAAVAIINGWVSDETRGKIKGIIEAPIDPATVMFLINAIYFNGDWTYRFDRARTTQAPFYGPHGAQAAVPLMEVAGTFPYAETEAYQAVDLPYGGQAFAMTVILPREGTPVDEVVAALDSSSWAALVQSFREGEGAVRLPRFRMEWEKVLNETLQAMGMVQAFEPGVADFRGISSPDGGNPGLFVSLVKQKAFVDVDEEGTEAAAATVVVIDRVTSGGGRFDFRADRPFLFFIRERLSGTILFAGLFLQP